MKQNSLSVRVASPKSFPLDPRYEQTRTAIDTVRPAWRVFEHYKRDSSRLLSLPDEVLWQITGFIAKENQGRFLSQFALAHRECWQLARPYQFADVWITRSELSWELLRHLKKNEEPASRMPSIGSFIRSLTITIDKDFDGDFGLGPGPDTRLEEWEEYWSGLLEDLAQAVQCSTPNLEFVYWMDVSELDPRERLLPAVLKHATSSGYLTKLYFEDYGFFFSEINEIKPIFQFFPGDQPFCLRDLAFGFNRFQPRYSDPDGATSLLVETILRRSASTLESYVWSSQFEGEYNGSGFTSISFRDGPINFSTLRKFWSFIWDYIHVELDVIECFLAAPLESFAPSAQICSKILENNLVERFPLPHLRTFALIAVTNDIQPSDRSDYVDNVLGLGRRYGSHLEELFIYNLGAAPDDDPITNPLVSHISSGDFCNLRSLCFSWVGNPGLSVLRAIGSNLLSLEELSFGFQPEDYKTASFTQVDWNFTWSERLPPRHEDFIAAIAPLKRLVRLSVFGDEYIAHWAGDSWSWHRFFKDHVWFHQGRSFIERKSGAVPGEGQTWSEAVRGHNRPGDEMNDWLTPWVTDKASLDEARRSVGDLALKYAEALPMLQQFISGRVLVEIVGRGSQDEVVR